MNKKTLCIINCCLGFILLTFFIFFICDGIASLKQKDYEKCKLYQHEYLTEKYIRATDAEHLENIISTSSNTYENAILELSAVFTNKSDHVQIHKIASLAFLTEFARTDSYKVVFPYRLLLSNVENLTATHQHDHLLRIESIVKNARKEQIIITISATCIGYKHRPEHSKYTGTTTISGTDAYYFQALCAALYDIQLFNVSKELADDIKNSTYDILK